MLAVNHPTNNFPIDCVDLCADEVNVTREGLQELAQIAFAYSIRAAEKNFNALQGANAFGNTSFIHQIQCAQSLAQNAGAIEKSLRFLNAFSSLAKGERTKLFLRPQKNKIS